MYLHITETQDLYLVDNWLFSIEAYFLTAYKFNFNKQQTFKILMFVLVEALVIIRVRPDDS